MKQALKLLKNDEHLLDFSHLVAGKALGRALKRHVHVISLYRVMFLQDNLGQKPRYPFPYDERCLCMKAWISGLQVTRN